MKKCFLFLAIICVSLLSSCSSSSINTTDGSDIVADAKMPEPFDQAYNSGGDSLHDYYCEYVFKFGNINSTLIDLVGEKEAQAWLNEYFASKKAGTESSELTVLRFIEHFDISKEELIKAVSDSDYPDGWIIDISDIEVIYSGNDDLIQQTFVNEYALLYNGVIYTPEWLYTHSLDDYAKEGLPIESVNACMEKMRELPFTHEAQNAIADKSTNYKQYYANRNIEEQTFAVTTTSPEYFDELPVSTTAA